MKPSLIHVCSACNPARQRFPVHGTPAQCRGTLNGTPLNDGETRVSYDVDPGDSVAAIVCTIVLAALSVGLAVGVGIGRALGVCR